MKSSHAGASIVEFIVGFAVFLIISVSLYELMTSGLQVLNDDQNRAAAVGIARKELEAIKNLPYDDVGTVGGVPAGNLAQVKSQNLNNVTYTITTNIQYVDDTFDGTAPLDTINTDYKKVRINVTWNQSASATPVTLTTNIVPTQIESDAVGGTLWIEVYDPTTDPIEPVANADVTVNAPSVNPPIATTGQTDNNGRFILPGVPAGIEAYQVSVTKPAYSTDQTYDRDPVTNPNPTPTHLNIVDGEVTTEYFEISQKVNLIGVHLQNYDTNDNVVVPFQLHGAKTIGTDLSGLPIYKYNQIITPNDGGNAEINDSLESDAYSIIFDEAEIGYVLAGNDEILPYVASPHSAKTITLYLAAYEPYTALLTVIDQTDAIVPNVSIRLFDDALDYDVTQLTTSYGQSFFRDLTPGNYSVTITAGGYATYNGTVIVNGNEQQTLSLAAN